MRSVAMLSLLCACASAQSVPTPAELNVPADSPMLLFSGKADGAQIYACSAEGWKLKAPDAEVTNESGERLRHYGGPTWEAADGTKVVGEVKSRAQVDSGAIPWLLLSAKSTEGSGRLARARWIQRVETHGGKAPDGGCDADHAGAEARVPYSAVYRFWGN